jgi:hypothetical protein
VDCPVAVCWRGDRLRKPSGSSRVRAPKKTAEFGCFPAKIACFFSEKPPGIFPKRPGILPKTPDISAFGHPHTRPKAHLRSTCAGKHKVMRDRPADAVRQIGSA